MTKKQIIEKANDYIAKERDANFRAQVLHKICIDWRGYFVGDSHHCPLFYF